jgi:hypothetical protein
MQEPLLQKGKGKEKEVVEPTVILKADARDRGIAQPGSLMDEERVPYNTPGNRHRQDISQPWRFEGEGRTEYFIPTLICFVFKSIGNLKLLDMTCTVVFTMVLRFNLKGLPEDAIEYLFNGEDKHNIKFRIDEREVENLSESLVVRRRGDMLFCTFRSGEEPFFFYPDLSNLPFDEPDLNLKFEMTSVEDKAKFRNYRFNCLIKKPIVGSTGMLTFKEHADRIPEYDFAISQTSITRPMETKKEDGRFLYVYYPITTVTMQFFRHPEYLVFSVVIPLLLLNLFTLSSFILEPDEVSDKLAILVTILLALFAFTFTVRQSIPSVPYLTGLEKQIFVSVIILFFAGLEAIVSYITSDAPAQIYLKNVIMGVDFAIVILYAVIFCIQYAVFKTRCHKFSKENDEFAATQTVKMQSVQPDFKWSECVGGGPLKCKDEHLEKL